MRTATKKSPGNARPLWLVAFADAWTRPTPKPTPAEARLYETPGEVVTILTERDFEPADHRHLLVALFRGRVAHRATMTCALTRRGVPLEEALATVRGAVASGLLLPRVPARLSAGWVVSPLAAI